MADVFYSLTKRILRINYQPISVLGTDTEWTISDKVSALIKYT